MKDSLLIESKVIPRVSTFKSINIHKLTLDNTRKFFYKKENLGINEYSLIEVTDANKESYQDVMTCITTSHLITETLYNNNKISLINISLINNFINDYPEIDTINIMIMHGGDNFSKVEEVVRNLRFLSPQICKFTFCSNNYHSLLPYITKTLKENNAEVVQDTNAMVIAAYALSSFWINDLINTIGKYIIHRHMEYISTEHIIERVNVMATAEIKYAHDHQKYIEAQKHAKKTALDEAYERDTKAQARIEGVREQLRHDKETESRQLQKAYEAYERDKEMELEQLYEVCGCNKGIVVRLQEVDETYECDKEAERARLYEEYGCNKETVTRLEEAYEAYKRDKETELARLEEAYETYGCDKEAELEQLQKAYERNEKKELEQLYKEYERDEREWREGFEERTYVLEQEDAKETAQLERHKAALQAKMAIADTLSTFLTIDLINIIGEYSTYHMDYIDNTEW